MAEVQKPADQPEEKIFRKHLKQLLFPVLWQQSQTNKVFSDANAFAHANEREQDS